MLSACSRHRCLHNGKAIEKKLVTQVGIKQKDDSFCFSILSFFAEFNVVVMIHA